MKNPLQDKSIRGSDTPLMAKQNYDGNIPPGVIKQLEQEIRGVDFGGVSLVVAIRGGHPTFRIEKTVSIMASI